MITFHVGNTEKASRIAIQAQGALTEGDTSRAQSLFREAAHDLERQISAARKQSEKDMLRFLAASQYYYGGLYTDAQRLCRRVQVSLLPTDVRPIFSKFVRDVNERSDPGYREQIREALLRLVQKSDPQAILDLLQAHPYTLSPGDLALIRASSCEQLKDYRAAALFSADVIRYAPESPELLFPALALPIVLTNEGKLGEAWEYVTYQLQVVPHALTSINASVVRAHQAQLSASHEEGRDLSGEQIRFFEDAWQQFQLLPLKIQAHATIREYMVLGFEAAALGYLRLNQPQEAKALSDRIVASFPDVPDPLRLRELVPSATVQTIDGAGEDHLNTRARIIGRRRQETMRTLELVGK